MFLTPRETIRDYEAKGWWAGESVDALLRRARKRSGDAVALVDPVNREALDGRQPERLSWNVIDARIDGICAILHTNGLRKDNVVLSQLPNTIDAVLLFLACARMGLILSPVAMQYRGHELAHVVDKTSPKAIVTVPSFGGHDHAAQAAKLVPQVLLFGNDGDGLRAAVDNRALADVRASIADHPTEGGEVLTICWTSGTESRPKGVPRDHNHWILNGEVVAEGTGMVDGDTLLNPFPLVNIGSIGGLVMPWLLLASKLVLHHPFDLGIFLR
ncbi:MAG TPA: class I adenylate-forming enzyme family protein, partial [Sphingomicrobium sp.]